MPITEGGIDGGNPCLRMTRRRVKHQPLGKTGRRASSKCKRQMVDEMLETPGSSGVGRQHIDEPLGEYLPAAELTSPA